MPNMFGNAGLSFDAAPALKGRSAKARFFVMPLNPGGTAGILYSSQEFWGEFFICSSNFYRKDKFYVRENNNHETRVPGKTHSG